MPDLAVLDSVLQIQYLVYRKFPYERNARTEAKKSPQPKNIADINEYLKKADEYQSNLRAKAPEEIKELYEDEVAKEIEAARLKAEQEDNERFFNRPKAKANFEFWSRAEYWTIEEAVALSFGRDPEAVTYNSVIVYIKESAFAKKYNELWELADRATKFSKLSYKIYPAKYIEWMNQNELNFPKQLEELVMKRGNHVFNWKMEHDKLRKTSLKKEEEATKTIAERDEIIKRLQAELEERKSITPIKQDWIYTTPYLELMQQSIIANNISADTQSKKELLKQWFLDNAPTELQISDKKADMMATLIRLPESSVGGNKKPQKK